MLESLWQDLIFVAQRLGYTSVKLTFENRIKCWEHPSAFVPTRHSRHELRDGHGGILELQAPKISGDSAPPPADPSAEHGEIFSTRLADPKVFCIMSELLAEGWANATKNWDVRRQAQGKTSTEKVEAVSGLAHAITAPLKAEASEMSS